MTEIVDSDHPQMMEVIALERSAWRGRTLAENSNTRSNSFWIGLAGSAEEAARYTKEAADNALLVIRHATKQPTSQRASLSQSHVLVERVDVPFVPPTMIDLFNDRSTWPHEMSAKGPPFFSFNEAEDSAAAYRQRAAARAISEAFANAQIESVIRTDPEVRRALCHEDAVDVRWMAGFYPSDDATFVAVARVALGIWRNSDDEYLGISETTAQAVLCILLRTRNFGRRYAYVDYSRTLTLRPSSSATLRAAERIASERRWLNHRKATEYLRRIGLNELALAVIAQANAAVR